MLVAKAEATAAGARGEMPLDYMIRVMRDPTTEPHRRDSMAKAAGPYLHPQLAAKHHRLQGRAERCLHLHRSSKPGST